MIDNVHTLAQLFALHIELAARDIEDLFRRSECDTLNTRCHIERITIEVRCIALWSDKQNMINRDFPITTSRQMES